ncbi:hypothetical protein F4821DRAFT_239501 [Hypoxylon rubiginosum]|uniref:Uncharacterized protein n=1 Tax=Hypoxylon rubiginosum TaxID=110542 RepID=A0ACC0D0B4_9PEZI|nr:hypothetical protein F4821DRAFT_239501 [Hypoxylon rubiginosum]
MESLRKQLHETQGALDEKASVLRKLKADQTEAQTKWQSERQCYETKVRRLEEEANRLRRLKAVPSPDGRRNSIPMTLLGGFGNGGTGVGGGDSTTAALAKGDAETVVLTKAQTREAELKYQRVKDELAEKTKLCDDLQRQLHAQGSSPRGLPELTDDQVMAGWKKLRGQIRDLSAKKFSMPQRVSDTEEEGYCQISRNWRGYIFRGADTTAYFVQALVWRCLQTFLFEKYCRVWGREYGCAAQKLGGFFMGKVPDAQFQAWRVRTAALFDKACEYDPAALAEVEARTCGTLLQFATGNSAADTEAQKEAVRKALREIVDTAAELSAIFHYTQFVPLMTDKPRSSLTHGFPLQERTMEVRGRQQTINPNMVVDMIVSPCLLKKDVADFQMLVKAEVIC